MLTVQTDNITDNYHICSSPLRRVAAYFGSLFWFLSSHLYCLLHCQCPYQLSCYKRAAVFAVSVGCVNKHLFANMFAITTV